MSKVLVDPAALEEAAKWLEVHSSSSGSAEAFAAEALREAIAQPAEAEGVEAVEFWVLFDATTPEPYIKKMMPEGFLAFFDHEEDAIRAKSFHPGTDYKRVPYVRQSDHLAALSAVTAERDMVAGELSESRVDVSYYAARNEQLRAEVERLTKIIATQQVRKFVGQQDQREIDGLVALGIEQDRREIERLRAEVERLRNELAGKPLVC